MAPKQAGADNSAPDRSPLDLVPPVDVIEDATGIRLYADLPGVPREKLQVRVEGDTLLLEGEMGFSLPSAMESIHAEVRRTRYRRSFSLSRELDPGSVTAKIQNGVLEVRIPKAPHAQPRRVEVQLG